MQQAIVNIPGAAAAPPFSVTDNFNRADAPNLGANWTVLTSSGAIDIITNQASTETAGIRAEYWSHDAFNGNQYSQALYINVGTLGSNDMGVAVRMQSAAQTMYILDYGEVSNTFRIYKCTGGSFAQVGTDISHTFSASETYKLTASGTTTVTLTMYANGSSIASKTDSSSTITGGSAGLYMNRGVGAPAMDNWEGGNL